MKAILQTALRLRRLGGAGSVSRRTAAPAAGALLAGCALVTGCVLLIGCAGQPAARIVMPADLAAAEPLTLQMPVGVARGEFRLGPLQGRFERQASRIDLAGRLAQDRALVSWTLQPEGLRAECKLLANTATSGIVSVPLKRARFDCRFSQDGRTLPQRLELRAVDAAAGTLAERQGRFEADGVTLELQSLHHLQGGRWPQVAPVGYLIRHQGAPLAALDLNDLRPRLWLRNSDAAVTAAVLQAALALALLWDPAAD